MSVKKAIKWRKTIKKYKNKQKINNKKLNLIIEAGRLAPSSMGLETTSLIIIKNKKIKEDFANNIIDKNNIDKVKKSYSLIFLLGINKEYLIKNEFLLKRINRYKNIKDEKKINEILEKYKNFLKNKKNLNSFINEQSYITLSFMVLQAAELKIGTTIIGGFNNKKADLLLNKYNLINKEEKHSIIILLIGNYKKTKKNINYINKIRIKKNEFVKII